MKNNSKIGRRGFLLPLTFLFFFIISSHISHSQTFMGDMLVNEYWEDTVYSIENTKVVWGIKQDTLCLTWEDNLLCFFTHYPIKKSKYMKKIFSHYRDKLNVMPMPEDVILRNLYFNRMGELYFITIHMGEGIFISIVRLDGTYPMFYFVLNSPPLTP